MNGLIGKGRAMISFRAAKLLKFLPLRQYLSYVSSESKKKIN